MINEFEKLCRSRKSIRKFTDKLIEEDEIKKMLSIINSAPSAGNLQAYKVVCGCFKITEQDLKDAIRNGANSFEEVQAVTKVGTGCGRCVKGNKELVNDLLLTKKIDENQVVCGCFKITVQDLENAIKNGAKSFEKVQTITKVGTGCGNCVESNKALVAQLLAK